MLRIVYTARAAGGTNFYNVDDESKHDLRRFGLRVQALRHQRGWTQAQLAAAAGIDRSFLATIESGKRNAGVAVVYRIARGLRVSPAALFADPSEPLPPPGRSPSGGPG